MSNDEVWTEEPDAMDMQELSRILKALCATDFDANALARRIEVLCTDGSRAAWVAYTMARFAAGLLVEAVGPLEGDPMYCLNYGDLEFPEREFAQAVICIMNGAEDMGRDIIINAAAFDNEAAADVLGFAMGYVQVASRGIEEL